MIISRELIAQLCCSRAHDKSEGLFSTTDFNLPRGASRDLIARAARRLSLQSRVTTESAWFARVSVYLDVSSVCLAPRYREENHTCTTDPRAHLAFIHSRGKPVFAAVVSL